MDSRKIVIIGSGPAGLTAAIYAGRADLTPLVFAGREPGGQLMWTTLVENYPGYKDGILGPDLMFEMTEQAKKFGAEIINEDVVEVDFTKKPFMVRSEKTQVEADSVIVAVGSKPKALGVPGEREYIGKGVSTCATCDAPFFRDKSVIVVGGGDAAMEESLVLSKFAKEVTMIVRASAFRASAFMQEKVKKNEKIKIMFTTEVTEIHGEQFVTGVSLINNQTMQKQEFPCNGVFIAIGHYPASDFLKSQLDLNERGYVVAPDGISTSIQGIYVAGDVEDYRYRQAITAAAKGCKAAFEAENYLEGNRV